MGKENPFGGKGVHGMAVDPKREGEWLKHPVTKTGADTLHPPIPFPETKISPGNAISDAFRAAYTEKSEPTKKTLHDRLAEVIKNRIFRLGLATGVIGLGGIVAANEAYQVPAVHQSIDNALERFGLKVVVPPTFDNKAEETVLGRKNSFYVTPEEYKAKGPPTVEGNYVNVPFFIRFNDGKEHIINVKSHSPGTWDISGDIQGGEVLVPAREDGTIQGGGGSGGVPYLYKPGMSFQNFSSWDILLADGQGGKIAFLVTTGALQTSKNLDLQRDKRGIDIGPVKGFSSIGTLLDNKPVWIASNILLPNGKMDLNRGATNISTTPTGQAYVIR